jgi:O-antigen/teichoic acid export membrane protein
MMPETTDIAAQPPEMEDDHEEHKQDLTGKSARGFAWRTGGTLLAQPITTLTTVVLARLLEPSDFGLVSMCAVFVDLASTINAFGLTSAIAQKKTLSKEETESAFWFNILLGIAFVGLGAAAAPLVAMLYRQPTLGPLFTVMSIGFFIESLNLIQRALMVRRMRFGVVATAQLVNVAVSGAVAITLALRGNGVWSLAAGYLAGLVANVIYIQWIVRFWPRPRLRWSELGFFLRFGSAATMTDVAAEGMSRVDSLVVGRWLGAATLGAYNLAFNLMMFPTRKVARAGVGVTLPALGRIQDDMPRFRKAYARSTEATALITIPFLAAAAVVGREIIVGLYGAKWSIAAVPFQVMCIAGVSRCFSSLTSSVFKGVGKPHVETAWTVGGIAVLLVGLAAGLPWGIVGVSAGVSASALIMAVLMQVSANRLIGMPLSEFGKRLLPSIVVAASCAVVAAGVRALCIRIGMPDLLTAVLSVGLSLLTVWMVARSVPGLRHLREYEQVFFKVFRRGERAGETAPGIERE